MNARRLLLPTLCTALGCLLFSAAPALALETHVFKESFASPGSGAGQLALQAPSPGGEGVGGSGVAVNATTGDVYVADTGNKRIDEFSAGGTFMMAFGANVGGLGVDTCTLVCSAGTENAEPGQFVSPTLIAVDNDASSPSLGDVYVGDTGDNVVTKFTAAGALIPGWGNSSPANGQLSSTFGELAGIAVDSAGTLDVLEKEPHMIFEFSPDPEGTFTRSFETPRGSKADGLAINSEGDFFKANLTPDVEEFGASGGDVGQVTQSQGATGLAVDTATGDLYVDEGGDVEHFAFSGAGVVSERGGTSCNVEPAVGCLATNSFGSSEPTGGSLTGGAGIAVDSFNGDVYVADAAANRVDVFLPAVLPDVATEPISGLAARSVTLNGTVNPEETAISDCEFEWGTETGVYPHKEPCAHTQPLTGNLPVAVSANLTGLAPDTVYHYRLSATNTRTNSTTDQEFTTLGAGIESESVINVTNDSASFQGTIEPNGTPATYFFQYSTSDTGACTPDACVQVPAVPVSIPAGTSPVEVTQPAQGLHANTVYHYRVVARSEITTGEFEELDGPDHTFTTQSSGGSLALADHRQWELVSPASSGAEIFPIVSYAPGTEAAVSGDAMAYVTSAPTGVEPEGNSNFTQVLSSRGADGWSSRDLAIPHNVPTAFSAVAPEYRVFSSDLSLSVAQPLGPFDPSVSPEASEQAGYLRTNYLNGEPSDFCTSSCYRPLVTGAEGFANVLAGVEFGDNSNGGEKCPPATLCGPTILAATPDLSHIVLYYKPAALTLGGDGFYEWSAGQLQPVPGVGQGTYVDSGTSQVVESKRDFAAISADGSRVYFNGGVRVNIGTPQARTIPVPGGEFEAASVEGERAFVLGGEVLSEFDLQTEASTPLATGVQGVIGASEDGSSVYFVSNEALAAGAKPGTCGTATGPTSEEQEATETCSLYVYHAGQTAFIATLSGDDSPDWVGTKTASEGGGVGQFTFRLTARVSPNGRWLAFMSQRSLTGYDNTDATSPAPCGAEKGICDEEVYLYHAPTGTSGANGASSLVCASCNPTGTRPHGVEYEHLNTDNGGLAGGRQIWKGSQWLAANVPGWTSPYHQSRYLSNEGRLFFNSSDALVPQDVNNTEDVYEYEPPNSDPEPAPNDTCTTESSTYSARSEGCVSLVSSGTSPNESGFLDASENGDDVFFLSSGELTPQSRGGLSVFDAHACTAASPCPAEPAKPVECQGDACQSPYVAPENPAQLLQGPPTVAALTPAAVKPKPKVVKCKRGFVKKKVKKKEVCVKKPKKKSKAEKSSHDKGRA
jgi:hypothetical protein